MTNKEKEEENPIQGRCVFCGYTIRKYGRGRQWAGSFEYGDKWICGTCGDSLADKSFER